MKPISVVGQDQIDFLCAEAESAPEGCFVELGVYKGGTAWYLARIAEQQGRSIYLYDTFTGIPMKCDLDAHLVGDFGDTSADAVRAAIPYGIVVQGVFPASLVPMSGIAFVHVDADQYQSIKDACAILGPMLVPGGKMVFDDVWLLAGATAALEETGWVIDKTRGGKAMVRF